MEAHYQIAENPDEETARVRRARTCDGHEVVLHASLWEDSPVLQDLIQDDEAAFTIDLSKEALEMLLRAHSEKKFPSSLREIYHLLMITAGLQLENLEQLCLKHLFRNPEFWKIDYPEWLPNELVITCFEASSNRLFRTKAVYMHELSEILKLKRGPDLQACLFRTFRMKVREFGDLGLECVPILFYKRSVPIVIKKFQGGPRSAICFDGDCLPFELFGTNFDPHEANVDAFYLKYATYIVYKSGTSVYLKDLRNRMEAREVLENCTLFISKEDDVFVVSKGATGTSIWKWIDDGNVVRFAVLHRTRGEISKIDFDPETGILLILKKSGSLSIRRNRDQQLPLMRNFHGSFHSAWFHNGRLFTLDFQGETVDGSNVRRLNLRSKSLTDVNSYPEIDDISDEDTDEKSERATDVELELEKDERLENFASGGRIMSSGGKLLRLSPNGLEMYDPPITRLLLSHGSHVALSELCLFP